MTFLPSGFEVGPALGNNSNQTQSLVDLDQADAANSSFSEFQKHFPSKKFFEKKTFNSVNTRSFLSFPDFAYDAQIRLQNRWRLV